MSNKYQTPGGVRIQICVGFICIIAITLIFVVNIIVGVIVLTSIIVFAVYYKKVLSKEFLTRVNPNKLIDQEKFDKWYQKGIENMKKGNSNIAIRYFKKALKSSPKNVSTLVNIGILYTSKAMLEEAIKYYTLSELYDPDNETAKKNLKKARKSLLEAQQFYRSLRNDPIEKIRRLKCLKCGSRDNLIPQLFQHRYRESEGTFFGPMAKETITTGIESTLVPFCGECSKKITNLNIGRFVGFNKRHQPIVYFKGTKKEIRYIEWIAHIFYEDIEN